MKLNCESIGCETVLHMHYGDVRCSSIYKKKGMLIYVYWEETSTDMHHFVRMMAANRCACFQLKDEPLTQKGVYQCPFLKKISPHNVGEVIHVINQSAQDRRYFALSFFLLH